MFGIPRNLTRSTAIVGVLLIATFLGSGSALADANSSGSGTWRVHGIVHANDQGSMHQVAKASGAIGDTTCACVKYNLWGGCDSYEGSGYYLTTWSNTRWSGRSSDLSIAKSVTRSYGYHAVDGWRLPCSTKLAVSMEAAKSTAMLAANTFQSLQGSAEGKFKASQSLATVTLDVPFSEMRTQGAANFYASGVSWSIFYYGSAEHPLLTPVVSEICRTCVTFQGSSIL